ncbi:MAG: SocA family protein [Alphaproteobacteria bacterium]|nr:SocA family protein [Alphaproteobacteria bacterium]
MSTTFQAAKIAAITLDWKVTNLRLQKMLYLGHMWYWGRHDAPLVEDNFEAWDYGPVLPELYHKLKIYGASIIREEVFAHVTIDDYDSKKKTSLSG